MDITSTISEKTGDQVTGSTFNEVNQLERSSAGGKIQVTGSVNRPGSTVTIAGQPAAVHPGGSFTGEVEASVGLNRIPIVVSEPGGGAVTTKYMEFTVENSIPVIYTYDANGNLEKVAPEISPNRPSRRYRWDAADRLIEVIVYQTGGGGEKSTKYQYNGVSERVGKTEWMNGNLLEEMKLLHFESGALQEREADGYTVIRSYVDDGEVSYISYTASVRLYVRDHLDSIREVVGVGGDLLARYEYDPFGGRSLIAGNYNSRKSYNGKDYRIETDLVMMLYRAYDHSNGIWLSMDPAGEIDGPNLYRYVKNGPISNFDSDGLFTLSISGGAKVAGGIHVGYNGGQFQFGFKGGVGAGLGISFDASDSGCRPPAEIFVEGAAEAGTPMAAAEANGKIAFELNGSGNARFDYQTGGRVGLTTFGGGNTHIKGKGWQEFQPYGGHGGDLGAIKKTPWKAGLQAFLGVGFQFALGNGCP